MFYSKEMINNLGYENIIEFIQDYVKKHNNCCILYRPNGVFVYHDIDTEIIGNSREYKTKSYKRGNNYGNKV